MVVLLWKDADIQYIPYDYSVTIRPIHQYYFIEVNQWYLMKTHTYTLLIISSINGKCIVLFVAKYTYIHL